MAIDRLEEREKTEIINEHGAKKTSYYMEPIDGLKELYCIRPARSRDLRADKEVILSSMLRSMQRDRVYALPKEE